MEQKGDMMMKISINRSNDERQYPAIEIDLSKLTYPYAIREAFETALRFDGYDNRTIDEVFGRYGDAKCSSDIDLKHPAAIPHVQY